MGTVPKEERVVIGVNLHENFGEGNRSDKKVLYLGKECGGTEGWIL